jgi:two-component system cell cycle response regulator
LTTVSNGENKHSESQVLIIDDSIDVHRLLTARLRNEPFEIVNAVSGQDGLRMAQQVEPAIILLDLDMPEVDGFEVLRQLKENAATVNVPVLVLSGLTDSQDKVAAFDLGAIDYITKPFDFVELRIRIRAALRLNELITMLARRAQIDGMSGLWNRVYFDNRLQEAVDGVARHGHALTVALVDLDHFKSINDTYGHPAGDTVIQGLASIVTEQCRSTDVCCRYGGEEFAIIMPDTTPEAAQAVCERIRLQLKDTVWSRHPERTVTGSFGVVGVAEDSTVRSEVSEWLEAADQNLYQAKQSGRDQIVASNMSAPKVRLAEAG